VLQILAEAPDMIVADEASTGREALRSAQQNDYDVVLLDISMPDVNGLEVLKQLRIFKPEQKVLILSMYPESQYAVRALKAGAAGYLTKESAPDELVAAVRKVSLGERYITLSLAEELAAQFGGEEKEAPPEDLSDREYQVMRLLALGKTVTEVAEELSLSTKTISTYRVRILQKLGLRNTAEIIRYAVERGLVD